MERTKIEEIEPAALAVQIKEWSCDLGFQQLGICGVDLQTAETRFLRWIANRYHGEMDYMSRHGLRRTRPQDLVPGTLRILSARIDYLSQPQEAAAAILADPELAYISRYALGRDYHKLVRKRLQQLANRIAAVAGPFGYRVFCDSAPVLEKPLAENAGLGWLGKHTNLVNRQHGSWFFLGEIYTDLPLPIDRPASDHCGRCRACLDICPTQAIIAPYQLDARRCISYLTIELAGAIPEKLRSAIGNRIYGCDDCLLICPWNRFARLSKENDFMPRHGLDAAKLIKLFSWSEPIFLRRMEGSPIRRLGYPGWQRNLAIALGNATASNEIVAALRRQSQRSCEMVRHHIEWALDKQYNRLYYKDNK